MAVLISLRCAWAELQLADGKWVNATIAIIASSPAALTLTAPPPRRSRARARGHLSLASRYGWGAVPMLSVYDKGTGLPLLPWSEKVVASGLVESQSLVEDGREAA